MSVNIRLPHITEGPEREQLAQIKSYLIQLADQLNWAFDLSPDVAAKTTSTVEVQGVEMSFYDLQALIIQEKQKVDALMKRMNSLHFKLDDGTNLY